MKRLALAAVALTVAAVYVDLRSTSASSDYSASVLPATGSATVTRSRAADVRASVAVVSGAYPGLSEPVSVDSIPSDAVLEQMVREAMMLGGIRDVLPPDAGHVLLKPCIVVANRDVYRNTDPRAVRAVALVVHEIAPRARITIGEGPGAWISEAHPDVRHWEVNIADGFETGGYRAALDDERLADAAVEFVDLNFAEARLVEVPDGGWARDEYWVAAPVLDADVTITVPRIKRHAFAELGGVTVSMKNQMGVAPGLKYGWPKKSGFPSGSDNPGIPHSVDILGEMITDLNLCAGIDFSVAESFRNEGAEAWTDDDGVEHRAWLNAVVAGRDQVAVDAVSVELMGFNHHEVETVVNGHRRGLGVGEMSRIDLVGDTDLDPIRHGFTRWGSDYEMGMANRSWIVSGPFPHDDQGMAAVDTTAPIRTGRQGFGEPVWFQDDKCDLGQLLGRPTDAVAFAYAEFDAPEAGPARLQLASDEGLTVWLNGEQVYRFDGWRRAQRPNDTVRVQVEAGRNRLLCRVEQSTRRFQFSVNVVDAEPSPLTGRHHRIRGLVFSVPGEAEYLREVFAVDVRGQEHSVWRGSWRQGHIDQTRPDSVTLRGVVPGALQAAAVGVSRTHLFGQEVRVRAETDEDGPRLTVSNGVGELWVAPAQLGVTGESSVSLVDVSWEWSDEREEMVEIPLDTTLVWSGRVVAERPVLVLEKDTAEGPWRVREAASPPAPVTGEEVVGSTAGRLESGLFTIGLVQSTGGALLADAYRQAADADVGLSIAWEVGLPVGPGELTLGDLLDLVNPEDARVTSWLMTGTQIDSLLEVTVDRGLGDARSTPQLSGFTATVDVTKPKGARVALQLEPDRQYRLATLEWYRERFQVRMRDIDWEETTDWPGQVDHGLTTVQAVQDLLAREQPYTLVRESRLVALNEPGE